MRDGPPSLRIALVEAPFGPAIWPSIGTSLLKAELIRKGHQARVLYANHFLLPLIGPADRRTLSVYQAISDEFGIHLGEWIFVDQAFPERYSAARDQEFLRLLKSAGTASSLIEEALELKARAGDYLDLVMQRFDWGGYDLVGFANTFSQLNASIAIARRLRQRFPLLPMIVGGAGCSDEMGEGVMLATPLFKAAALGEADALIVDLCEAICGGDEGRLAQLPGIAWRDAQGQVRRSAAKQRVTVMDELPMPQYDDYYTTLPSAYRPELPFYLPVEASRGCWWGAKHHCVFCGLNPDRMKHYSKTPDRFLEEIGELRRLYQPGRFMAVDNIMPHEYYEAVLPRLDQASGGAEFFFEVKANFREEQLRTFSRARVIQIQPGIESLSSHVLALMKKGTSAAANILTLRLCEDMGIRAHWSILHGIHGELAEDYLASAEVAKRLFHLRPPLGIFLTEIERFAPMFRYPELHGLANLRPSHWYRYCYPVTDEVLGRLAYRFDCERIDEDVLARAAVHDSLAPVVDAWRQAYDARSARLDLVAAGDGGGAVIERRRGAWCKRYRLSAQAYAVCALFDRPRNVARAVPDAHAAGLPTPYLERDFAEACERALDSPGEVVIDGDPAAVYQLLLLHGLVVQENGIGVTVFCRTHDTLPTITKEGRFFE